MKDLERQAENSSVTFQKIGQAGDKLQAVGNKVPGVGKTLTKSVSAPMVGLGTAAVNALLANTGESWAGLQRIIIESGSTAQQMADTQLDNLRASSPFG